jgi:hypothetical protein
VMNSMLGTSDDLKVLVNFGDRGVTGDSAVGWKTMSDALFGGNSECTFEVVADPETDEDDDPQSETPDGGTKRIEKEGQEEKKNVCEEEFRVPTNKVPVRKVHDHRLDERPLHIRELEAKKEEEERRQIERNTVHVLPKVKGWAQRTTTGPSRRGVFSGHISLQKRNDALENTGFCGAIYPIPWYNQTVTNCEVFVLRVKTDGRQYKVNLQNDSFIPDDLYQGVIDIKANEWRTIKLKLQNFALTSRGVLKPDQRVMDSNTISSIGFSIEDGKDGPFRLEIDWALCAFDMDTPVPM